MIPRAKFDVLVVADSLVITDRNDGDCSVTNDIEAVAHYCLTAYPHLGHSPAIVYRDSEGRWDGVSIVGGRFAGFVSLGAPSAELALIGLLHENISALIGTLTQSGRLPRCFSVKGYEGARAAFRLLRNAGLN